jgi:hypothetical protein
MEQLKRVDELAYADLENTRFIAKSVTETL